MSKLLLLLISILLSTVALADDEHEKVAAVSNIGEITVRNSGFATFTNVSDHAWFNSIQVAALNTSIHYDQIGFHSQISTDSDVHIRRAVAEYSIGNSLIQVGRIPRISGFFSNVSGNPDEWGLAILPLATYNRRAISDTTFNTIDGVKLLTDINYKFGNLRLSADFGHPPMEDKQHFQQEISRVAYDPSWDAFASKNNYNINSEITFKDWTFLSGHYKLKFGTSMNSVDKNSVEFTNKFQTGVLTFDRVGVKYATQTWTLQAEHSDSRLYATNSLIQISKSFYVLSKWHFSDRVSAFVGRSEGSSRYNTIKSHDSFAGVAHRCKNWTATIELHNGNGTWTKYSSNINKWNSIVTSITYRF